MKTATISHAKNHLSELLAGVKRGESVLILERDRAVRTCRPVEHADADDERLADLDDGIIDGETAAQDIAAADRLARGRRPARRAAARSRRGALLMRFWERRGLVPLLVPERATKSSPGCCDPIRIS